MNVYQPLGSISLGSLYQGSERSTVEQTNPPAANGPAATIAHNTGTSIAGSLGIEVPLLIALGVLAVVLVRYYD